MTKKTSKRSNGSIKGSLNQNGKINLIIGQNNSFGNNFEGTIYRTSNNWLPIISVTDYESIPIKYLEIGAFYGANIISVGRTYGAHPDSQLFCIDPWLDYDDYFEYKNQQSNTYDAFLRNIAHSGEKDKIIIRRGFSLTRK